MDSLRHTILPVRTIKCLILLWILSNLGCTLSSNNRIASEASQLKQLDITFEKIPNYAKALTSKTNVNNILTK